MATELEIKSQRLAQFLDRHHLDGVLLTLRNNFAWITCGRDNHIANNSPVGVASILATRDGKRTCLTNTIEAPRMRGEELTGCGIEVVDFPWHDDAAAKRAIEGAIAGRKIATDSPAFGLPLRDLPATFAELRWSLTSEEIARYRTAGKLASQAMESACRDVKPGMTGHEIAGVLDHHVHARGLNPVVTLVSVDAQVSSFRHPIPKDIPLRRHVMLVTCAEMNGLIACLTRFVHVGKVPSELAAKHQAVCNIDAAVNLATRPGRTLGEIFDDLRQAYADNGYANEWQNHHQGGSTGYAGREVFATPGCAVRAMENQAFAWNPSIPAAKSEDTILCTHAGIEIITPHSNDWPTITGHANGGLLPRAGILELE